VSSKYPNEYDEFLLKQNALTEDDPNGDFIMAEDINSMQSSIQQIQSTLGINPQGVEGSVANRLAKGSNSNLLRVPAFLIYLGDPSVINGSSSIEEAAGHFARFEHVVLGRNYSEIRANLITETKQQGPVKFYGYLDAGVTTLNLSLPEINTRIQQWMDAGVDGIYLDKIGYDSEVSRGRQNSILDAIHSKNGVAILSAPNYEDVLTDTMDPLYNPNLLLPHLEKGDVYHYGSFAYDSTSGGEQNVIDTISTINELSILREEKEIEIFGSAVISSGMLNGQDHFDYAHGFALLASLDAFYALGIDRGEATDEATTYNTLPLTGEWYEVKPIIKSINGAYERMTGFGKIVLDEEGISLEGISIPSSLIHYEAGTLDGSILRDGSVTDQKIGPYNGDRLIDAINAITSRGVRIHFDGDNATGIIPEDVLKTNVVEAINAYIGIATIHQAKIGELSADKITAGTIQAERISATVIAALDLYAASAVIDKATINSALIGQLEVEHISANVIESINLVTQTAQIESARIVDLHANKIVAGDISADRIRANVVSAINTYTEDLTVTGKAVISAAAIAHLTADHIEATVIEAINLNATLVQIQSAKIQDLNASKIVAGDIKTELLVSNVIKAINAELQTATINEARIDDLNARKIVAGDIDADRMTANIVDAVNIRAGIITAGAAVIDSAAIGILSASHMQTNVLAAIDAYVGTATINKAKIGMLDANNIEANAITTEKINAFAIIAGKIDTDAIETRHIKALQIVAGHIAADAITAGKISADAITAREIAVDAIQTKHIMADAVTAFEIAANAVTAEHILAGEVTTIHLAADSITTDKIAAGAVTADEILADSVKAIHIDALAIQAEHLAVGSVRADHLDALSITAGKIAANAVTADTIAANAVTVGKINAGAVTAIAIAAGAVTTEQLFANAVTAEKISANAITADKIMAESIDATKIAANAITAKHIAFNTLDGEVIRSRTIHGDKIIAGTLSANILEAGSITSVEIAAKTITSRNLAAGSVDADVLRAGTITANHISTRGLDAEQIEVYNGSTGQTLIQGGFLIVDGLDVGVVQSDNLIGNGLFLTASSAFGNRQDNPDGITESREAVLGNQANAQGGHQVWKIDLMDDNVLRKVEIPGRKPVDIAIDMDDTYAYITVQGDDTVVQMALDSANHSEVLTGASRNAGKGPGRIRFTGHELGDHKHFFIMNTDPKDVNIPDLFTIMDGPPTSVDQEWYVHHNIPIGNGPYDSITNTAHQTYISLSKQGDIALIDMTNHNSAYWKVVKNIPIAAYATDNYHGGLDGNVGLNNITAGDSSSKYSATASAGATMQHAHGGYGTSDGSLVTYEPRGLAFSADGDHIYVADYANNQLVVVDVTGSAPYNALTGDRRTGNLGINGNPFDGGVMPPPPTDGGHVHSLSAEQEEMVATIQAGGHSGHGVTAAVDTTTKWVRYRIPIGQSPDFVEIVNGKIFVTLEGSGRMAIINEADVLAEIDLDRIHYVGWNEFFPMRALPTWNVRTVDLGSKPSHMKVHATMGLMGTIYVSLMGQNQIAVLDVETETVSKYINVGASPKGIAFTQDGRYMYVVNHGGGGELSFVYPRGNYIGDPYLGLEGGVEYQGAEHWVPSRSKTHVNKDTGVVESQAKVEFRINEPFLNEGGYAKLSVFGKDIGQGTVYAQIEQDVTAVTNYSNGNNVRDVDNQRLDSAYDWKTYRPRLGWVAGTVSDIQIFSEMRGETLVPDVDGKTFRPSKDWIDGPTKPVIFKGTTGNYVELRPEEYVTYYHGETDPRIVFNETIPAEMSIYSSSYYYKTIPIPSDYVMYYDESTDSRIVFNDVLAPGSWVTADFTHRDNRYWKPHNGSVSVAVENASSPNFYTQFEVEEFVPKFVSIDNQQTAPFTFAPVHNPSRTVAEYTGIQYSLGTNRALGAVITASSVPTTGVLASIVDGQEPIDTTDEHATHTMSVGEPIFTAMHVFGEEVVFPAGLQHVVIDLGGTFMIGKVVIQHAFHKKRKYHATKTEVSEDGITWVTVFDSTVSGEYNEYTDDGLGNMVYGNHIIFDAFPIQYIRDWSNGYTEYDALWTNPVEYTENHWTEIKVFGDWEFETGYVYPANTAQAGQQIATNGRGVVTTDIPGAQVAIDLPIEFTSWWYMTYLVGPEFGQLDVEMPTVMGGSHSLFQDGTYLNKTAHKHIMSWPPSHSVKADPDNYIKAGLHRAVIRQKSGKVSIDRFRFEDYQYLTKSSTEVPKDSSLNFTRRKLVPNQAQWYIGNEIQSTEGPYDTPRINTDTQLRDYSVPIKYRFVVKSRMEPQGITEERGTAYVTSAIFETGKLSSHWRMSQTQDSFPGSRIEAWDPNLPHKTGLQHFHLANGSVRGSKLMPLSVMNHHISPYAKITESKLDLNNPTHAHGHTMMMDMGGGTMMPMFMDNKHILDSIHDWGGNGVENKITRSDHDHDNRYIIKGVDGSITGDLTITGNIIVSGLVDGVDVGILSETMNTHIIDTPIHLSAGDRTKLDGLARVADSAINGNILINNVESIVYAHPTGAGNNHVPTAGVSGNFLKWSVAGTAAWSNITWADIKSGVPLSFTPSAHTHLAAEITDLYTNIYTKQQVNDAVTTAGDIKAAQLNTFTNVNTFANTGLAIKIQPSTAPSVNTVLFQLSANTGTSLITMDSEGDMVIEGNLIVRGVTTYNSEQTIEGDMNVAGNLNISGSSVLGDDPTDQTTIKGDLRLEGQFKHVNRSVEITRFPVYGVGGDLQFQTDSTTFEDIISHYSTFNDIIAGSVLPVPGVGAQRRYRLMIAYSTQGVTSDAQLRIVQFGTTTALTIISLPTVNGGVTGIVRHFLSPEFTTSYSGNTTLQAISAGASKDLVIKYIEVIAYDYYS
jgi:YVTN family beta-propeller protein